MATIVGIAAVIVCVIAGQAGADTAQPWSRWRGADGAGQGGDRRFPLEWTEADWAWTAALPGRGHASPVVRDGRIYTASADEQASKRFVTCHTLADGKALWSREISGPIDRHHVQNSSASGSVAVGEEGVYWTWAAGDGLRVEAFTLAGGPKWHVDLGTYQGEHGFGGSASVCGDLVIVSNDQEGESFVVALDAATGRERWRLPRESGKSGYATPLVIDGPSGLQIVLTSNAHGVTGIDAATGEVRWRGRVGGTFSASPIAVGGTIRNVSADGEMVTLADGDEFEVLGRATLGEECRATPAVVGGRMVFRTASRLIALDAETP